MNILTAQLSATPPSKEQLLQYSKKRFVNFSRDAFQKLLEIQNEGIRMMWENPKLKPQEIIDELGESALNIFQYHSILTKLIVEIAKIDGVDVSNKIKLPKNAFIIDQNTGTITVTEDPYIP